MGNSNRSSSASEAVRSITSISSKSIDGSLDTSCVFVNRSCPDNSGAGFGEECEVQRELCMGASSTGQETYVLISGRRGGGSVYSSVQLTPTQGGGRHAGCGGQDVGCTGGTRM
jgi:hypothetical protein